MVIAPHTGVAGRDLPGGLRERKKLATRRALQREALLLAAERGPVAATVEEISERAGVSVRTFFNYFASKDEAIAGDPPTLEGWLRRAYEGVATGERTVELLCEATVRSALDGAARRDEILLRRKVLLEHPVLAPRMLANFEAGDQAVTRILADHLGVDPAGDPWPGLLAAVAAGVLRTTFLRWDGGDAADVERSVRTAFDRLAQPW